MSVGALSGRSWNSRWDAVARVMGALRNPRKVQCWFRFRLARRRVRRVEIDGEVLYAYDGDLYPAHLNQGNACAQVAGRALRYCSGSGIDVGPAEWPLPGAIPVRDEPRQNAFCLDKFEDTSLDFVFSSHCLEHLEQWQQALILWIRKLRIGGYLVLYLPHESMRLWHPGGPWAGLAHKWVPTSDVLIPFLYSHGVDIVEHDAGPDGFWSFCIVGRRGR